ncbi:MAG: SpoVR family protein, partial [Tatlockia sp.]|nr:SpoVR family protein [Tatlockia sp.]
SPHLIRELKLFYLIDDDKNPDLLVGAIHDEQGYQLIREALSRQYNLGFIEPNIQVYSVDVEGDRSLTLQYAQQNRVPMGEDTSEVLKHLHTLWKFPVILQAVDSQGQVTAVYHCPPLPIAKTTT